jgi:hypothetical protein
MYMVRKIKVIDVYEAEPETNEEANEPTNTDQASEPEEPPPPEASAATTDLPNEVPTEKPTKKPMLNMPTTQKVLQQVECQACKRKMSAKTLKYNHAPYCPAREREEKPEEIPIPRMEIKNGEHLKNTASLPVKRGKLKRSKPITKEVLEEEAKAPASTPALPVQPPQIEQSFHFQMRERLQQKEAKYQVMMSNAF